MNVLRSLSVPTNVLKRYASAVLAGVLISTSAASQTLGTAFTDLWWNPSESGWGVNVDHQQDVMFLTFFIYRADSSPYWVVAVLNRTGSNPLTAPPVVFSGDLLETKGPPYGAVFNPAAVTNRKVGTATFSGSLLSATLQYSIDGVSVTKNIVRQTLRNLGYAGQYLGGTVWTSYECLDATKNNVTIVDSGTLTVVHTDAAFQLTAQGKTKSCTFKGTYSQQGSVGQLDNGTYSCDNADTGTVSMTTLQWTNYGMTAGLVMKDRSCSYRGYAGGIARAVATPPPQWANLSFVISPDVYQVVSETDQSLVILGVWKPGQRDQMHSHLPGTTVYYLTDCSFEGGSHAAGTSGSPLPGAHVVQNVGASDCRVLFFEPK